MPSRPPSQKLINVPMDNEFVSVINDAVQNNYSDRSKVIREAIAEKLEGLGIKVPPALIATPSLVGKGGRAFRKKRTRPTAD
jgi:hypothetical protein